MTSDQCSSVMQFMSYELEKQDEALADVVDSVRLCDSFDKTVLIDSPKVVGVLMYRKAAFQADVNRRRWTGFALLDEC